MERYRKGGPVTRSQHQVAKRERYFDKLQAGVEKECKACLKSFTSFRALGVPAPRVQSVRVDIIIAMDCVTFKDQYAILAEMTVHVVGHSSPLVFRTLHFACKEGVEGVSYVIQSVVHPGKPLILECYPRMMLSFAISLASIQQDNLPWHLSAGACVGVLGMGANVITDCVATVCPDVQIHVVERESAIVTIATEYLKFPIRSGIVAHIGDAFEVLNRLPSNFQLLFLDCFDPIAVTMLCAERLLRACKAQMGRGAVLVTNAHMELSAVALQAFCKVFGSGNVHATGITGWDQVIVVCFNGPRAADGSGDFSVVNLHKIMAAVNASGLWGKFDVRCNFESTMKQPDEPRLWFV